MLLLLQKVFLKCYTCKSYSKIEFTKSDCETPGVVELQNEYYGDLLTNISIVLVLAIEIERGGHWLSRLTLIPCPEISLLE